MPVLLFLPKSTLTPAICVINKAQELPFVKFKIIRQIGKVWATESTRKLINKSILDLYRNAPLDIAYVDGGGEKM